MKSWCKKFVVVASGVAMSLPIAFPGYARPGDADTQMQVEIDQYTAKIKANPRDFDSILQRGILYRKLGKMDLCEADGKSLISVNSSNPSGYWLLSRVAKDRSDFKSGLKWIRESIAREKPDVDHFHYELNCLNELDRYSELINRSLEVEKLFPKDAENFYYRALGRYNLHQAKQLVKRDLDTAKELVGGNSILQKSIEDLYKSL